MGEELDRIKDEVAEWSRAYRQLEEIEVAAAALRDSLSTLADLKMLASKRERESRDSIDVLLGLVSDTEEWEAAQDVLKDAVGRSQAAVDPSKVIRIDILGDIRLDVEHEEPEV